MMPRISLVLLCGLLTALAAALLFTVTHAPLLQAGEVRAEHYSCPMHPEVVTDAPGACPKCGMPLEKTSGKRANTDVAILIFDGVQIIDYTAPYEIFGQQHLHVFTVAETKTPIVTTMNMKVTPEYSFEDAPTPFILVLPGGDNEAALRNPKVIDWIRKTSAKSEHVLSVCNGAFFLAKAGLLDGLSATTFHALIPALQQAAPKTRVVRDKKFVDNGKIITAAGLSSGIEGSLYLVSKIYGMERARELALHLEYNWQPDSPYVRANLADQYIGELNLDESKLSNWHPIKNIGGMDNWVVQGTVQSDLKGAEILKLIQDKLVEKKTWSVASTDHAKTSMLSFQDDRGQKWMAFLSVDPVAGELQRFTLTLSIDRKSP